MFHVFLVAPSDRIDPLTSLKRSPNVYSLFKRDLLTELSLAVDGTILVLSMRGYAGSITTSPRCVVTAEASLRIYLRLS